jgi:predicted amidohydrolase YtcJ
VKKRWRIVADAWRRARAPVERVAVDIEGDRIVQVHTAEDAAHSSEAVSFSSPALLIPAFHDSHTHLLTGGLTLDWVSLADLEDVDEAAVRLEAAAKESDGRWLDGYDYDEARLPLNRWMLDKIVPDVPVYIRSHDLHSALVNSKTLAIAGLGDDAVHLPRGRFERDTDSRLNGMLREQACEFVLAFRPPLEKAQARKALQRAQTLAFSFGITAVGVSARRDLLPFYFDFVQSSEAKIRLNLWKVTPNFDFATDCFERRDDLQFRFATFKGFLDGALGSQTAALWEPYANNPNNMGILTAEEKELARFVETAAREDFQVALHAIGDRACSMALNAFEAAHSTKSRMRLEHAQIMREEDIRRMADLGVIASMQPIHAISDMKWVEERIGRRRARQSYAWRSIRDAGVHLCFGSDWPVETMSPFEGICAAITRQDGNGNPPDGWIPEQRLTVEEALEAYTESGAYAARWEEDLGTIAEGKLADLVVLSCNPFLCEPKELLRAEVLMTVCGGEVVYQRNNPLPSPY